MKNGYYVLGKSMPKRKKNHKKIYKRMQMKGENAAKF